MHEYRTLGGTGLILDPARQKCEEDDDEVRGGDVRTKLYFLSSRHVLGVQDARIPRVFKDSSFFVREAARRAEGRSQGGS